MKKPETANQHYLIDAMGETLKRLKQEAEKNPDKKYPVPRKQLGDEIGKDHPLSASTVKSWLSTFREYLQTQGYTSIQKPDGTPGYQTVYWRLDE